MKINKYKIIEGIYKDMEKVSELLNNVIRTRGDLFKELSKKDREVSDILHEIELDNLDAVSLMHWASKLRKTLRDRRAIKMTITMLDSISQTGAASKLNKCIKNAQARPAKMEYSYREMEVPIASGKKIA